MMMAMCLQVANFLDADLQRCATALARRLWPSHGQAPPAPIQDSSSRSVAAATPTLNEILRRHLGDDVSDFMAAQGAIVTEQRENNEVPKEALTEPAADQPEEESQAREAADAAWQQLERVRHLKLLVSEVVRAVPWHAECHPDGSRRAVLGALLSATPPSWRIIVAEGCIPDGALVATTSDIEYHTEVLAQLTRVTALRLQVQNDTDRQRTRFVFQALGSLSALSSLDISCVLDTEDFSTNTRTLKDHMLLDVRLARSLGASVHKLTALTHLSCTSAPVTGVAALLRAALPLPRLQSVCLGMAANRGMANSDVDQALEPLQTLTLVRLRVSYNYIDPVFSRHFGVWDSDSDSGSGDSGPVIDDKLTVRKQLAHPGALQELTYQGVSVHDGDGCILAMAPALTQLTSLTLCECDLGTRDTTILGGILWHLCSHMPLRRLVLQRTVSLKPSLLVQALTPQFTALSQLTMLSLSGVASDSQLQALLQQLTTLVSLKHLDLQIRETFGWSTTADDDEYWSPLGKLTALESLQLGVAKLTQKAVASFVPKLRSVRRLSLSVEADVRCCRKLEHLSLGSAAAPVKGGRTQCEQLTHLQSLTSLELFAHSDAVVEEIAEMLPELPALAALKLSGVFLAGTTGVAAAVRAAARCSKLRLLDVQRVGNVIVASAVTGDCERFTASHEMSWRAFASAVAGLNVKTLLPHLRVAPRELDFVLPLCAEPHAQTLIDDALAARRSARVLALQCVRSDVALEGDAERCAKKPRVA